MAKPMKQVIAIKPGVNKAGRVKAGEVFNVSAKARGSWFVDYTGQQNRRRVGAQEALPEGEEKKDEPSLA